MRYAIAWLFASSSQVQRWSGLRRSRMQRFVPVCCGLRGPPRRARSHQLTLEFDHDRWSGTYFHRSSLKRVGSRTCVLAAS